MRIKTNKLLIFKVISSVLIGSAFLGTTAVAQEGEDLAIEEILVTAQKRAENLREVPIAISVFGADAIDHSGVQELRELSEYIPNVLITQGTDFGAQVKIRGVGANSRNIGFDSRVGVYLDGVYLGPGPAMNQDLVDLDHIEILRGPQGTLFGKNTVGGAVNMISTKPGPDSEFDVSANLGNYNALELKVVANFPFSETVSARISGSHRERDGYVDNIWDPSMVPQTANFVIPGVGPVFGVPLCHFPGATTPPGCAAWSVAPPTSPDTTTAAKNVDTQSYRAQLRFQPNENLDINIAMDDLRSSRDVINGEPFTDTFGSTLNHFSPEYGQISFSERSTEKRDIFGANLNIDYNLDNGYSLRSITAYRDTEIVYHHDTDTSPLDFLYIDYTDVYEQTTQEIQLISPDNGTFNYVAGFYYYNQDSVTTRNAVAGWAGWLFSILPGGGAFNSGEVETDSWAVFMNGTYEINDHWRLGVGFRYSDETKDILYHLDGTQSGVFLIGNTPAGGLIDSDTYTNFSPTVSLSYAMGDDTNLYAKYSTGFKSGGFNLDYVTQVDLDAGIDFDEETVDSYELGMKSVFMDGRLSLNVAAFISMYDDYQVNQFFDLGFDPVSGTQATSIRISNAAKVETSGLEFEAVFNVSSSVTLNATLGILDAKFDDFPGGTSVEVPDPTVPGGVRKDPVNAAGNKLPLAPDLNASFGIEYRTRLGGANADLLIRLDANHVGDYFTTIENETSRNLTGTHGAIFTFDIANYFVPNTIDFGHIDALTTLNGRIGLIDGDGSWEVYLWGRNLTDEGEYVDMFRDFFGSLSGVPMIPRTYGVEIQYHF